MMITERKALLLSTLLFLTCVSRQAMAVIAPTEIPDFQIRFRVTRVGQQQPTVQNFVLGSKIMSANAVGSQWSNWMTFGAVQMIQTLAQSNWKQFPLVIKLQLAGVHAPTFVDIEVRLTGKIVLLKAELDGPKLGILFWRNGNTPQVGTMADYNRQMIWNNVPPNPLSAQDRPRKFPIIDRFIGGSDDAIEWREGIAHLAQYGLNVMLLSAAGPTKSELSDAGIDRVSGAVYSPPGYTFDFPYLRYNMRKNPAAAGKTTTQLLEAWAQALTKPYLDTGYNVNDVALYNMADEPGWYFPSVITALQDDPTGMALFHRYLQAQNLQPADLGAASWDQVQPIGTAQATTAVTRRLFYWTTQFFPWDSARYFAASTQAMNQAFYPGIPNPVNWNLFNGRSYVPGPVANNPDKASSDAAMGGQDWFQFAQMHGSNMLFTEGWFNDEEAYMWSYYAAKLGSAARDADITWGGYVIPRTSGQTTYGLMQKVLSIVGNGGKAVDYFVFGPEYNFPGNCYSERAAQLLPEMAQVNGMIAKAEPLLWPGKKPQAQVAILQPRSSEVWDSDGVADAANNALDAHTVDYMAEIYDLYRSLQQQDIPADFVAENALTPDGLRGYKVLYVTEPDFPQEYMPALLQWVHDGGTLVSASGALTADRYDIQMSTLQQASGIVEAPHPRLMVPDASRLNMVGSIGTDWKIYGLKATISKSSGDTVASFNDHASAILERKYGHGAFIHYAFFPGISAYASRDLKTGLFPATALKWIAYPVRHAGVQPPVTVSQLNVETPMLLSARGAAITLLDWRDEDLSTLNVTAHLPFQVKSVESVDEGHVTFHQVGDVVSFSMPLRGADIILLKK